MAITIDLSDDESECVLRALTGHINTMTTALRANQSAQLSLAQVERMYADIRTAAVVAGRLPFRPVRLEHA
jgi:hypothetical protein